MPNKPRITPEEWVARKAVSAARATERSRQAARAFQASLSPEEKKEYNARRNAKRSDKRKAQYAAERERTRAEREARRAEKRASRAARASEQAAIRSAKARAGYQTRKLSDPEGLARARAAHSLWRQQNIEHIRQWKRDYYKKNREKICREASAYAKAHRKQQNDAKKRRRNLNPELRILDNLRDRLTELLAPGTQRSTRTSSLTGCTRQVLRSHLESKFLPGMGWYNYGSAWHVDHVKPCVSFALTDREQQLACFHYTNLQPLWDAINTEKSDSLTYDTAYAVALTPYPS